MSQSGYTPIQLYRSSTARAAPVAGNLAYGELGLNYRDGALYYKDVSNAVQLLCAQPTATLNFYVNSDTGNDTTGDGTSGSPYRSIGKVLDVIPFYNLNYYGVNVHLASAANTYDGGGLTIALGVSNQYDFFKLMVTGDTVTPSNCKIGGLYAIDTTIQFNGVQFTSDLYAEATYLELNSTKLATASLTAANAATVSIQTGCSASGNLARLLLSQSGSVINLQDVLTLTGTPAYTEFCRAQSGTIFFGAQPVGAATGVRAVAELCGIVNTQGGGNTYLPGNSNPTTATGGQYV